ncbi:sugar transporter [Colletotrichum asianum]|uniref:Sugar transporter n=1 Tax=Colletotrichum asianum TaxID=702518 RepID=A0A8H3WHV0_9PEZI|nr:sugar transporter [Colletotrichum asianum]
MRTIWLPARRLPFSQEVTWSMGLLCLILGLNVLSNGFDLSVYNTIQAMDCLNDSRAGFDGETELAAMKANLEQHTEKGSWADLFRGTDLRRTTIALLPPFFSQATGQAFANVYGTIFYQSLGTINPFVLTIISQCFGLIGSLSFMLLVDRVGRRFFWKSMAPLGGVSMMILGGLGTIRNPTQSEKLATACMLSLFGFSSLGSLAQLAAVTPAEVPSPRLRGKSAMMAWTVNNFSNFIATFTLPYLMNPGYGNLGPKVAFIYGSFSLISVV